MEEIGLLVHGEGDFVLFKAYVDESGIHAGSTVCIVAGFVATLDCCRHLEAEWKRLLHRRSVAYFHAKEFAATGGVFRGWDDSRKHRFISDAYLTINTAMALTPGTVIGAAIPTSDFFAMTIDQRRWFTGGTVRANGKWRESGSPKKPYFLPFQQCVMDAFLAADGKHIHFIFDQQKDFESTAKKLFGVIKSQHPDLGGRFGDIVYSSKLRAVPLQIADFIAYESYQFLVGRRPGMLARDRTMTSVLPIFQGNNISTTIHGRDLSRMLSEQPIAHEKRFIWPMRHAKKQRRIPMGTKVVSFSKGKA